MHPPRGAQEAPKAPKSITSPRRLLVLAPSPEAQHTIPRFLLHLTGSPVTEPPLQDVASGRVSFAGYTTHAPLHIETKYYSADIPIWVDELPMTPTFLSSSFSSSAAAAVTATTSTDSPGLNLQHGTPDGHDSSSSTWKSDFLSLEAREVRDVIGALVICIQRPAVGIVNSSTPTAAIPAEARESARRMADALRQVMRDVAEVKALIEEERDGMGDIAGLLVSIGSNGRPTPETKSRRNSEENGDGLDDVGKAEEFSARWWEEELVEMGIFEFEAIEWDPNSEAKPHARNECGELIGLERAKEVLESNEWGSDPAGKDDGGMHQGLLESDEEEKFDMEVHELEREVAGMKLAIMKGGEEAASSNEDEGEGDDELRVEQLDALMIKAREMRDTISEMPAAERRRFAEKVVNDMIQNL